MYFPYFRGKQYELAALRELSPLLAKSRKIIPIIEPVRRRFTELEKAIKVLNLQSISFILVVNPQEGDLKGELVDLTVNTPLKPSTDAFLGYIISPETTAPDIKNFLDNHQNFKVSFIHFHSFDNVSLLTRLMSKYKNIVHQIFIDNEVSFAYRNAFSSYQRILIRDGFRKAKKNALYPPDEFFSDIHLTYNRDGNAGFGDFATIGRGFDSGGIAHAVAIHLTYYQDRTSEIKIRHFVSDRTTTSLDIAGKFVEALKKLIYFLDHESTMPACGACKEFRALYTIGHFPQLGPIKKLSIKHHVEMMSHLI